MKKTIGIFAHVDAGKTTLCEALLYNNGATHKKGYVDSGNTIMDAAEVERQRGITCFSGAAGFKFNNNDYYLIDTPGHSDFLPDTERCMAALDCAVLCVSGVEGIESNTELLWELLLEYKLPVIIFINKCDRDIADKDRVLDELRSKFSRDCCYYMSAEYTESVAASNEELMEDYFEGTIDENKLLAQAARLFADRSSFPVLFGSALSNEGVAELMDAIDTLCITDYSCDLQLSAEIFKVKREKDKRWLLCHIRSGRISVRDELAIGERISEIRIFDSAKSSNVSHAMAGDVVEICGISSFNAGDHIGKEERKLHSIPTLSARVIFPPEIAKVDMLTKLRILEDEEPTLSVEYNDRTDEISVKVMGRIELEILEQRISERFGIDVSFGKCEVIYKETLCEATLGYGHYEPLRHYSEVHLRLEPAKRGSGISFESECSLNTLTSNYQNLIKTHVFEKVHKGVLIGAPLTDVRVVLTAGASHKKHTEGGDFRESTYRAVRHGLMRGKSMLLEPYLYCRFSVEPSLSGRVISDITAMCAKDIEVTASGNDSIITACIPAGEMTDYQSSFISYTRGKGRLVMSFHSYGECHNESEVIERYGYEPEKDLENSPDSIFCSHGAGFFVPWREVEKYIHCK